MTAAAAALPTPLPASGEPPLAAFFGAVAADEPSSRDALQQIGADWHDGYAPLLIDLARLLPSPTPRRGDEERIDLGDGTLGDARPADAARAARLSPGAQARARIIRFLEQQTGQRFGDDLRAWRRWMWSRPDRPHSEYARFKRTLYSRIDPRLGEFFPDGVTASIRLDEVDWGGVPVNGIPPLEAPRTIPAAEAAWLRTRTSSSA